MVNNFVIDHVLRGIMTKKNGEYMWSINQITNPSLNVALSDTAQAVDALGTVIQEFDRGRSAEFGAENSIFDLSLYAAQMGREVEEASGTAKITVPAFETIDVVGTDAETYVTKKTPVEAIAKIYVLNGDGTLGKAFAAGSAASADEFAYEEGTHTISLPTGLEKGSQLFVMYEYETESAVEVVNSATEFPVGCKFVMEVLGCDVCDQTNLIYAYVIFNNFKLSPDFDWSVATDGAHPFSGKAQQDYCDKEKRLELMAA